MKFNVVVTAWLYGHWAHIFCENTKHSKLLNKHETYFLALMAWPSILFLTDEYSFLYDHSYESYGVGH